METLRTIHDSGPYRTLCVVASIVALTLAFFSLNPVAIVVAFQAPLATILFDK
jgi:hypothetical protein